MVLLVLQSWIDKWFDMIFQYGVFVIIVVVLWETAFSSFRVKNLTTVLP